MVALVIAMVWTLPKTCNPAVSWYQGSVMYEIFPGSYSDSDNDGIGDLKGLASKIDYIQSLRVRAVRLNSIFEAQEYPEKYLNVTSLTKIASPLGTMKEFAILKNALHSRNISLLLDLPIWPIVRKLSSHPELMVELNDTDHNKPSAEFLKSESDEVANAMQFWVHNGVDGFYLKGLEHLVNDDNFRESLRRWKKILGDDRVLIVSHKVVDVVPTANKKVLLNNVDLVDVRLEVENGVSVFLFFICFLPYLQTVAYLEFCV